MVDNRGYSVVSIIAASLSVEVVFLELSILRNSKNATLYARATAKRGLKFATWCLETGQSLRNDDNDVNKGREICCVLIISHFNAKVKQY